VTAEIHSAVTIIGLAESAFPSGHDSGSVRETSFERHEERGRMT
jgi:hypothetical protein